MRPVDPPFVHFEAVQATRLHRSVERLTKQRSNEVNVEVIEVVVAVDEAVLVIVVGDVVVVLI